MSAITTHVLDTSAGKPAAGVPVYLERSSGADRWEIIGRAETDADGRAHSLMLPDQTLQPGIYRLTFHTQAYFARSKTSTFYPGVIVVFEVVDAGQHYHVPLLVSPFGYSTYRGS